MNTVLRTYAQAYASLSGFNTDLNPRKYTMFNTVLNLSYIIIISAVEPTGVLPLNVIWLNEDKLSSDYQTFLVRTSKTATAPYSNTWQAITDVTQLYIPQYYDTSDNAAYAGKLVDATSTVAGVAKLSYVSSTPLTPVFVAVGDPRMKDNRNPKAHTHAEKALRQVKTLTGNVDMTTATSKTDATTIVADSATSATQRKLAKSEVI